MGRLPVGAPARRTPSGHAADASQAHSSHGPGPAPRCRGRRVARTAAAGTGRALQQPGEALVPLLPPRLQALDPDRPGLGPTLRHRPPTGAGGHALPVPARLDRHPLRARTPGRQPGDAAGFRRGGDRPLVRRPETPRRLAAAPRPRLAALLRAGGRRARDRAVRGGRPAWAPAPALRHDERDGHRGRPSRRRPHRARAPGPAAVRRPADPHQGGPRRHPGAGPARGPPRRPRRGRGRLRPHRVRVPRERDRPRRQGLLPRRPATSARGAVLPGRRRLRVPQLSRARGQRAVRGHGSRPADGGGRPRWTQRGRAPTRAPSGSRRPTRSATPAGSQRAIRSLVEDPDLRLRWAAAARNHVLRTGTWESGISQMEEVYAEVAGRGELPGAGCAGAVARVVSTDPSATARPPRSRRRPGLRRNSAWNLPPAARRAPTPGRSGPSMSRTVASGWNWRRRWKSREATPGRPDLSASVQPRWTRLPSVVLAVPDLDAGQVRSSRPPRSAGARRVGPDVRARQRHLAPSPRRGGPPMSTRSPRWGSSPHVGTCTTLSASRYSRPGTTRKSASLSRRHRSRYAGQARGSRLWQCSAVSRAWYPRRRKPRTRAGRLQDAVEGPLRVHVDGRTDQGHRRRPFGAHDSEDGGERCQRGEREMPAPGVVEPFAPVPGEHVAGCGREARVVAELGTGRTSFAASTPELVVRPRATNARCSSSRPRCLAAVPSR